MPDMLGEKDRVARKRHVCSYCGGTIARWIIDDYNVDGFWMGMDYNRLQYKVTAWMPKPEPWKGDKTHEEGEQK